MYSKCVSNDLIKQQFICYFFYDGHFVKNYNNKKQWVVVKFIIETLDI